MLRGLNLRFHSMRRRIESVYPSSTPDEVLLRRAHEQRLERAAALRRRRAHAQHQAAAAVLLARQRLQPRGAPAGELQPASSIATSPSGQIGAAGKPPRTRRRAPQFMTQQGYPQQPHPHERTGGWAHMQGTAFPSALAGIAAPERPRSPQHVRALLAHAYVACRLARHTVLA